DASLAYDRNPSQPVANASQARASNRARAPAHFAFSIWYADDNRATKVSGYDFKGKVALVTGSASGIGCASAIAFASAGAKVVVSDVDDAGGEQTVARIKGAGCE